MRALTKVTIVAVLVGAGGCAVCSSSSSAADAGRSAEQILKELDQVEIPVHDASKKNDTEYSRKFLSELKEMTEKRSALILELYKASPDHGRVPRLMAERWTIRPYAIAEDTLFKEIEEVLAHTQNPKLKIEAVYARTYARLYRKNQVDPLDLSEVDGFLKLAPNDPRGAALLNLAARRRRKGSPKRLSRIGFSGNSLSPRTRQQSRGFVNWPPGWISRLSWSSKTSSPGLPSRSRNSRGR